MKNQIVGFGGSCHWCTEAIFQSLKGVALVEQGWIASQPPYDDYSESVRVYFDPEVMTLETLIHVHLYTHSCTSDHSMRGKYRSSIYTLSKRQCNLALATIAHSQSDFDLPILTQILPLVSFKLNKEEYLDYYYRNPDKPFCKNIINPKLQIVLNRFKDNINSNKLNIK